MAPLNRRLAALLLMEVMVVVVMMEASGSRKHVMMPPRIVVVATSGHLIAANSKIRSRDVQVGLSVGRASEAVSRNIFDRCVAALHSV